MIQRFGGALNLNPPRARARVGRRVREESCRRPELSPHTSRDAPGHRGGAGHRGARIKRLLDRHGLGDGDNDGFASDAWADDAPVLAGLAAASVQGTVALGPQRGARLRRLGDPHEEGELLAARSCHAQANGFDLHAGLVVLAGQRDRLERVCRYALRAVAQERIHLTAEGQVRLQLRQPWRDGTTDIVFDPVGFLGRLAVLVPRPRINLILYHGVLGPRAAWRAEVVRRQPSVQDGAAGVKDSAAEPVREADPAATAWRHARSQCWASLMARTCGLDVLACPRCGGRLRLIALIEEAAVIDRILRHLGVPTEIPAPRPARAPPLRVGRPDQPGRDDGTSVFDPFPRRRVASLPRDRESACRRACVAEAGS